MKLFSFTIIYLIIYFTPFQIFAQDSTDTEEEWKWDEDWKLEIIYMNGIIFRQNTE